MYNIDLNLDKVFLTVFELKNLSKAAEKLYVSQPAISYSLKELEKQLGFQLFFRTTRGVEPTVEGQELYFYISNAFNIIRNGENALDEIKNLKYGTIRLGTPSHIGIFYLTKYIQTFRKIHPGIKFEIISKSTKDMVYMLETRNLDLIVDSLPITSNRFQIDILNLTQLNNCFACTKELKKQYCISRIKDLEHVPLIIPSATSSIRKKLEKFIENENTKLEPVIEVWTTEMMLEMVRQNMGVGYFIEDVIASQKDNEDFVILDLDVELPKVDISIAYVGDFLTTAAKSFIEFLSKNAKEE